MWTIIIRAAALIGIGFGVGSMSAPEVPAPVYREASSSISPFLVISVALLVCAAVYFVWSLKRSR